MSNIRILNLSAYTKPEIKEVRQGDWVEYGEDNNYFQYLIDRYNGSATNNAIINGMCELIYGKGLDATDSSRRPNEYAMMMSLFKKKDLRRVSSDLKMMGQAAFQVIYSKDHSKITEVHHIPVETLRAEKCNDSGDIDGYYYAKDWSKVNNRTKPQRIPAFGTSKEGIEILYIRPYRAGYYYYSPVDYQGAIPYAELEEEIANYHINNIQNGLAPSMLINFNNGVPTEEQQNEIERKVSQKFSGSSNAGRFILAFNSDKESAGTIEPVQLSDASEQYQFLADESMRKLMVGHRVTSPMLLGIKDQSGLGNNAEELQTATALFDNTVIRPYQELIIDALDQILAYNEITLNLYFKTLQPLEFKDAALDKETQEEETGVKMASHLCKTELEDEIPALGADEADAIEKFLAEVGENEEDLLEGFEFIDSEIVGDDEPEDFDAEAYLNSREDFAAQDDSTQDNKRFKVRYAYVKGTRKQSKSGSRDFCSRLISQGKVYRKEDIGMMSARGVNKKFGHKGRNYSIFKYKGGPNCHHRWERRVYRKKLTKDGEVWGGGALNGTQKINVNQAIRQGFKLPKNPKEVAIAPIDMPNNGFHPDNPRKPKA